MQFWILGLSIFLLAKSIDVSMINFVLPGIESGIAFNEPTFVFVHPYLLLFTCRNSLFWMCIYSINFGIRPWKHFVVGLKIDICLLIVSSLVIHWVIITHSCIRISYKSMIGELMSITGNQNLVLKWTMI